MKIVALALTSAAFAVTAILASGHAPAAAGAAATFTEPQSVLGAKAYAQNCSACHGAKLQGVSAPALVGKTSAIAQQTVVEVYEYESQQMPMTAPGSLSKSQYVDILAFLLEKNGHKPGTTALNEDVAKTASTVMSVH